MATPPRPWTADEEQRLRDLHAEGKTLTAVARELDTNKTRVSRKAKALGLDWDRTQTENATRAKKADADARITRLLLGEVEIAEHEQQHILDVHRGKGQWHAKLRGQGGSEYTTDLPFIPIQDKRDAAAARQASVAVITKYRALLADDGKDLPAVDQWLSHMLGGDLDGG